MKLQRTCISCRKKNNKNELIRIVSNDNKACLDISQKINSRGIYLCKSIMCIGNLEKIMAKNKLKIKISADKESILNVLNDIKNELGE